MRENEHRVTARRSATLAADPREIPAVQSSAFRGCERTTTSFTTVRASRAHSATSLPVRKGSLHKGHKEFLLEVTRAMKPLRIFSTPFRPAFCGKAIAKLRRLVSREGKGHERPSSYDIAADGIIPFGKASACTNLHGNFIRPLSRDIEGRRWGASPFSSLFPARSGKRTYRQT